MLRPGSSMRFEGLASPRARGPDATRTSLHRVSGAQGDLVALADQCQRLQLLVGELLLKNQELRCEVARLRAAD
jgi:hypothetical protein